MSLIIYFTAHSVVFMPSRALGVVGICVQAKSPQIVKLFNLLGLLALSLQDSCLKQYFTFPFDASNLLQARKWES